MSSSCLCRSDFTPSSLKEHRTTWWMRPPLPPPFPQHAQVQVHDVFQQRERKKAISASCLAYEVTFTVFQVVCAAAAAAAVHRAFALRLPLLLLFSMTTNNFSSTHSPIKLRNACISQQSRNRMENLRCAMCPGIPVYHHIRSNKLWIYFIRLCVRAVAYDGQCRL